MKAIERVPLIEAKDIANDETMFEYVNTVIKNQSECVVPLFFPLSTRQKSIKIRQ